MKPSTLLLPTLASLALARPHSRDGSSDQAKSRITAFTVDERGQARVECWELRNMVNGGEGAGMTRTPIAKGKELRGVDHLSFEPYADIYPIHAGRDMGGNDGGRMEGGNRFNLIKVQAGLVRLEVQPQCRKRDAHISGNNDNDNNGMSEVHVFSLENGDDWFYFEDNSDSSNDDDNDDNDDDDMCPIRMESFSSTGTQMMHMTFMERPRHNVLHEGACDFTGIRASGMNGGDMKHGGSKPINVQVHVQEGL